MSLINQQGSGTGYLVRVASDWTGFVKLDGTALSAPSDFATFTGTSDANDGVNYFKVGGGDTTGARLLTQLDHTYDDSGVPTIKLAQTKFGGSLDTIIDAIIPRKSGSSTAGMNELIDIEGNTIGGTAAASGITLCYIEYSTKGASGARVCATFCSLKSSSGSYTMKNKEWVQPPLELVGVSNGKGSAFSVGTSFINPSLVTTAAAISIADKYYEKAQLM